MPQHEKNILNFGYRINLKYEGILVHSFDRFYVITKFILSSVNKYISNPKVCCRKIIPFVKFYKKQISPYNCTVHNIFTNKISLILPNLPKVTQERRNIVALLITHFIDLAYDDISSYLHNRRQKAIHSAVVVMENKVNLQCIKIIHLETHWFHMVFTIQKLWKN